MSERTRVYDYISYIKSKRANIGSDQYDYNACYNKAFDLKDTNPTKSIEILTKLVAIRKDPDVVCLLNELSS